MSINLDTVLYILGAITVLAGAIGSIKVIFKPFFDIIEQLKEDSSQTMEAVLLLLKHAETDNNTKELASQHKKLRTYILNRR